MTISTNSSFDLSRDEIIRVAYQYVGVVAAGEDPDAAQIAMGSDVLNIVLKALQNDGIILSKLERTTTTLIAGTAEYATASDTLDIDKDAIYVSNGTGTDIRLRQISRGMYMELTKKDSQGQPSQMYVEKLATVSFFLYPIPDANWTSITYPRYRLLSDMDAGDVTSGLPSKYLDTVTMMLAERLALHHGLREKHKDLQVMAERARQKAVNDDTERGDIEFVPRYGIRFGGRW